MTDHSITYISFSLQVSMGISMAVNKRNFCKLKLRTVYHKVEIMIDAACVHRHIMGIPIFRTFQCEDTKGIINSRIIPAIKALPKESRRHNVGITYQHLLQAYH